MNRTYTHDGAGNVKTISGITKPPIAPGTTDYSTPAGTNRISGSTGQTAKTYTYDNAGKIISDGVRTFTYNQNGQLIRVTAGSSVIAEYAYDAFSRRVKKTAGGSTVLYHYGYDGNLISETDGTGNPLRDYVYLNGESAAMKLYGTGAGWYFFLNDHLGTPQKIVNASGAVVWEAGYMPFGEARVLVADIENNLRFPGQYFDAETGQHYNWHRYYDPDTGRYLTPDPIGLAGGMNLYVYVNGNPLNFIDILGLKLTSSQLNDLKYFIKRQEKITEEYRSIASGKYQNSYKILTELRKNSKTVANASGYRSDFYKTAPQEIKDIIDIHESYHVWNPHFNIASIMTLFDLDIWAEFLAKEEVRAHEISNRLLKELYEKESRETSCD